MLTNSLTTFLLPPACQVELPKVGGSRSSKKRKHSQQQDGDADGDAEMQDAEGAEEGATPAAEGSDGSWDFSLLQPRHKNLRDAAAQKKVEDELKQVGGVRLLTDI
jgi:hypothetical protein